MLEPSMPRPEDLNRLRHLREAGEKAILFSQGKTRRSLDDDEVLRLALTKLVEIVGEAAKQVSAPTRVICAGGCQSSPRTVARASSTPHCSSGLR